MKEEEEKKNKQNPGRTNQFIFHYFYSKFFYSLVTRISNWVSEWINEWMMSYSLPSSLSHTLTGLTNWLIDLIFSRFSFCIQNCVCLFAWANCIFVVCFYRYRCCCCCWWPTTILLPLNVRLIVYLVPTFCQKKKTKTKIVCCRWWMNEWINESMNEWMNEWFNPMILNKPKTNRKSSLQFWIMKQKKNPVFVCDRYINVTNVSISSFFVSSFSIIRM